MFKNFTFKTCVAARDRERITKTLYFEGSWSFKVINVDTLKLKARY